MAFMFEKLEVCQNAVTLADDQAFPRSADLTLEICLLFEVHITRAPRDPIHKPPKCLDFLNIGAGEEPGLETTFLGSPGRWPLNDSPDSWREPRLKNPGQDVDVDRPPFGIGEMCLRQGKPSLETTSHTQSAIDGESPSTRLHLALTVRVQQIRSDKPTMDPPLMPAEANLANSANRAPV